MSIADTASSNKTQDDTEYVDMLREWNEAVREACLAVEYLSSMQDQVVDMSDSAPEHLESAFEEATRLDVKDIWFTLEFAEVDIPVDLKGIEKIEVISLASPEASPPVA
jgi:hypothetical protein